MKSGAPLKRTELKADPDRVREFNARARANTSHKRRPISPASPAQREAIKGRPCIVSGATEGIDPAHIVSRALGGCDSPLCVVPLRRDLHRAYDAHELDLLPYLEAHGLRAEIAHAVMHLGLLGALQRLTGVAWTPVPTQPRRIA